MALIDGDADIYSSRHYRFLDLWALHWLYRRWGLDDIFPGLPKPGRNITQPTVAQLEILKQLRLSKILSPKYYRPVLESDRYRHGGISAHGGVTENVSEMM